MHEQEFVPKPGAKGTMDVWRQMKCTIMNSETEFLQKEFAQRDLYTVSVLFVAGKEPLQPENTVHRT